jgi:hypothetical protein
MEDPAVNIVLIVELHMTNESMSNNYRSEGFGKLKSNNEMLGVSIKSTKLFTQSSRVFA